MKLQILLCLNIIRLITWPWVIPYENNRILSGDTFGIICFCYALVYCSVKEVLQFLFSTRHEIGALVTKVFDITIGYML